MMSTALAVVALAALLWGRRRLQGTTMMAPSWWAIFAIVCVAGCEIVVTAIPGEYAQPARYAAAMTTFAPIVAVLGAKRPQDRAWQFIVLTLLVVLWIPAIESALFARGEPMQLRAGWPWWLLILWVVGLLNYLPTRHWPACLMAAAGQWALVSNQLPFAYSLPNDSRSTWALALFAAAAFWTTLDSLRPRRRGLGLNRLWLDFRNTFGAAWALRVAGRMQEASNRYEWRMDFHWNAISRQDFHAKSESDVEQAALRTFRAMLRRFVSPAWIADRLP